MESSAPTRVARVFTLEQAAKDCDLRPDELLGRAANGDVDLTIRIPSTLCAHIVVRNYVSERPGQGSGKGALFPHLVMPIPHQAAREVVLTRTHCSEILAFGQCDAVFFPAALEYSMDQVVVLRRLLDQKIIPGWRERYEGRGYVQNKSMSAWLDFGGDPPMLIAAEHDELSYLVSKKGLLYPKPDITFEDRLSVFSGDMPYPAVLRRDLDGKIRMAELVLLDEKALQKGHTFEYWFALYPTGYTPGINPTKEVECPFICTLDPSALRISEEELGRIIPGRSTIKPEIVREPSEFDFETHKNTSSKLKALNEVAIKIWSPTTPYDDTFPTKEHVTKVIMEECQVKEYLAESAEQVIRPDFADPNLPPEKRARLGTSFRSERWKRLVRASKRFWADIDPTDPAQCPHNDEVENWLVDPVRKHMPEDVAKHMAGLIRPDNAKRSRRK